MVLLTAILLPLLLLVLLAVLVCLLLVAALALVVLMERTGADVPAAAAGLRARVSGPRAEEPSGAPAARTPWSRRTPAAAAPPAPAAAAPEPAALTPESDAATVQLPTASPAAPRPAARAAGSRSASARTPAPSSDSAPPTRTRPVRKPKSAVTGTAESAQPEDRQAAMDRLFAPLTDGEQRPD